MGHGLMEDYHINQSYMSSDLSKHILQGDKSHVGIIPLLIFKYKVLRRWVSCSFNDLGLCPTYVAVLQEKTKSRGHCFVTTQADADQSWLGKLRPSAVAAFRLLEAWSKHMFIGFRFGVLASLLLCSIVADP